MSQSYDIIDQLVNNFDIALSYLNLKIITSIRRGHN